MRVVGAQLFVGLFFNLKELYRRQSKLNLVEISQWILERI